MDRVDAYSRRALSRFWIWAGLACAAAGCNEFATPAELATTQILAIRAEPPAVPLGERSQLDILVADNNGPIAAPDVTWEIASTAPGGPLFGTVAGLADGRAEYTAPASADETPVVGMVRATVHVDAMDASRDLEALKAVVIGDVPLVNPTLTAFNVDQQDALLAEQVRVSRGEVAALELATDPAVTDESTFAWYSTVGEIERYQSNPTELLAGDQPASGWLIGVVRDGRGGVVWRAVELVIE